MATLGAKLPSLCCLINIILLMLLAHRIYAARSNFPSMEHANNGRGASTMLKADKTSKQEYSSKASLFLLAKGHIPPSGPSHRGHEAPHFAHRSP